MRTQKVSDAEVNAALRALVAEDESAGLAARVVAAITRDASSALWAGRTPAARMPVPAAVRTRLAFAGGALLAIVLVLAAWLNPDVRLPAAPDAPAASIDAGLAPLPVPEPPAQPAAAVAVTRVAARVSPAWPPLIEPLDPPAPLEVEYLRTSPIDPERLRIQPMALEPLEVGPLEGD